MMTLVAIIIAYRYGLKIRHCLCIMGILLIIATVYLRYHYLIDVLAGAALALPCLMTSDRTYSFFKK